MNQLKWAQEVNAFEDEHYSRAIYYATASLIDHICGKQVSRPATRLEIVS
jgi:hypothetical protein